MTETIGKRALEIARINSLKPMAVCVLDARGQTLFFQMEDGNPLFVRLQPVCAYALTRHAKTSANPLREARP